MIQIINANGVTIINGTIVNGKDIGRKVKSEEKRKRKSEDIDTILINSGAIDVDIVNSDTSMIEALFIGQLNVDNVEGKTKFDFEVKEHQLVISVDFKEKCYFNNLKLIVSIPSKMFEKVCIYSVSADVKICGNISTKLLRFETATGDLEVLEEVRVREFNAVTTAGDIKYRGNFSKANIQATNGDIKLKIDAKNDIDVDITTATGDVSLTLNNIKKLNLLPKTRCGDITNNYSAFGKYNANVQITTNTGDIKIK